MQPIAPHSFSQLTQLLVGITPAALVKSVLLVIAGLVLGKILGRVCAKALARHTQYQTNLIRRIIFYVVFLLFFCAALQHLGFKLNVLLGAAGILTVALGFASQMSVSNIISGLFLMAEKPFVIGDYITVNNASGEVLSIDLLSIKLRTSNNTLLRIPNESLIKSNIINVTKFPIRRFDVQLGIAYKENVDQVREILLNLANKNGLCLAEPKPIVYILNFGESAVNLQFCVWATKQNFTSLTYTLHEEIKKAFAKNNIEMPFPQISISTASDTGPFPVVLSDPKRQAQKDH